VIPELAGRRRRAGVALPLALFALLTLALMISLLLDAAMQEYRTSGGEFASVRASAAAERGIAVWLGRPVDSAIAALPRGGRVATTLPGPDSVALVVQSLGGSLARLTVSARVWSDGARADAGAIAMVRFELDTTQTPAVFRPRPLPGWWWTPNP
jgi:hypothetical protein